jgi:hypothetical protein
MRTMHDLPDLSKAAALPPLRPLAIALPTLCQIAATVGGRPAEYGGMLGAGGDDVVRHFAFDRGAARDGAAYSPDTVSLSRLFREHWKPRGIRIVGFVHSHPPGVRRPSGADEEYAARLLDWQPGLDRLLMPIVMAEPDGGVFEFLPYVAMRAGPRARVAAVALDCVGLKQVLPMPEPVRSRRRLRWWILAAAALAAAGVVATVPWTDPAAPRAGLPSPLPEALAPTGDADTIP